MYFLLNSTKFSACLYIVSCMKVLYYVTSVLKDNVQIIMSQISSNKMLFASEVENFEK